MNKEKRLGDNMSVLKYTCINCGGELKFKPKLQKWQCDSCRSVFEKNDLENKDKIYEKVNASEHQELNVYRCNTCGAELVALDNEIVTRCTYCRNTTIIKDKLVGKYEPSLIIPFKNTKEEVKTKFSAICRKHKLSPNDFHEIVNYNIVGIYVPFWLYDADISGEVKFRGTRSSRHRRGDYIIVEERIYDLNRSGCINFEGIPHDGSQRMDDALMSNIEPYDYKALVPFNVAYLAGFQAEKYDEDKDAMFLKAAQRAKLTAIEKLKSTCRGYSSVTVQDDKLESKMNRGEYVLLPVWIFDINYRNKVYQYTMNGQTGKLVGNFPISTKKVLIRCFLIVFIISVIIPILIGLFVWR